MHHLFLFGLLSVLLSPLACAQSGPTYASPEAQNIIENMVNAHGGLDAWESLSAFQFTTAMYLAALPITDERTYHDNWRYYTVTLDPSNSQGSVELPWESETGPHVGFDGTTLWRRPYTFDPVFQDSPLQLLYYHYSMLVLPWLTQQANVTLTSQGTDTLPHADDTYHKIEMSFTPDGKTHEGSYILYIDPTTFLLRGFTQTTFYPLLPGDVLPPTLNASVFPGMYRVIDAYATVRGLTLPRSYTTRQETEEGSIVMGGHIITELRIDGPLDTRKLIVPAGAEVIYTR